MGLSVLIVDDSATTRAMIRRTLLGMDVDVTTVHEAGEGRAALDVLGRNPVDLVLTDLHMPGMTGPELCEAILSSEKLRSIPVILLTSEPDATVIRRLLELGVRAHIAKPLNPTAFRRVLRSVQAAGSGAKPTSCDERAAQPKKKASLSEEQLREILLESLQSTITDAASLLPISIHEAPSKTAPIVATVAFTGEVSGSLEVIASSAFGRLVAGRVLEIEQPKNPSADECRDALGEVANMSCAMVLRRIIDEGSAMPRLSPPQLVEGGPEAWSSVRGEAGAALFTASGHRVAIRLRRNAA